MSHISNNKLLWQKCWFTTTLGAVLEKLDIPRALWWGPLSTYHIFTVNFLTQHLLNIWHTDLQWGAHQIIQICLNMITFTYVYCIFFLSDPYQVRPWSAFVWTTHPPKSTTLSPEIESWTSDSPKPSNPYIFWKLMSTAIQKWQRDTNTKTMTITNTKTKTKTKTRTPRQYLEHLQCAIFSESWWLAQFSPALPRTV